MKYKALIFDVGDTLLESYPTQRQIYAERLRSIGLKIDIQAEDAIVEALTRSANEQIIKEQNGEPRMTDNDFENMLDLAVLDCFKMTSKLMELRKIPLPEQTLRVIPGTLEVLQLLENKGYRMGIVSNHRAWLPAYLEEVGLARFFETIVVSDVVGIEKPDIRIMQIALENMRLDAPSCLYVGDHPFDVLCAKAAGLDCAWITVPESALSNDVPYTENYRIQSLDELLQLL